MTFSLNSTDVFMDVIVSAFLAYLAFSANCTALIILAILSAMMTAFIPHPMIRLIGALTTSLIIARIIRNNGQICKDCCKDYIRNTVCKSCCPSSNNFSQCYNTMTSLCGSECFKSLQTGVITVHEVSAQPLAER